MVENKGFEVKCLNCGSHNINIDFEKDIFWCGDCKQKTGCLDYGQAYPIKEEILEYNCIQLHEACDNIGHSTNWENFEKELKTYTEEDKENLLEALKNV